MIVLDASAAVFVLIDINPNASLIAERLSRPEETLHTTFLLDAEVVQALRRYVLRKQISAARAATGLAHLRALRITRYPYLILLERMWELRANLTAFDAAYVALAEALDAPLVTCDGRLARAGHHRAMVELFPSNLRAQ